MSKKPEEAKNPPLTPLELATIFEANSNSSKEDKAKEGWIMSVSKTFCGATAALMAIAVILKSNLNIAAINNGLFVKQIYATN